MARHRIQHPHRRHVRPDDSADAKKSGRSCFEKGDHCIVFIDTLCKLQRPRLLLLDEHTAALDPRSADRIIVLDKGCIAEEGGHAALLARKGLYYNLHKLQFETV